MDANQQKTLVVQVHAALKAIQDHLTAPNANVDHVNALKAAVTAIAVIKQQLEEEPQQMKQAVEGAAGASGRTTTVK